jgi:hypothetical protein
LRRGSAEELVIAAAGEVNEANAMIDGLPAAVANVIRLPPRRCNSANLSQGFCESRNDSAN